jgi:hypothetical protein
VIHHLVALAVAISDGGHHHDGNGRHNRNIISVHSPTHNHGYQHTNNSNAGGTNPTQNALCRHVTVCKVTQKIIIVRPERPAAPAPAPAPAIAPALVPAPAPVPEAVPPPVQALPQIVVPQSRARAERPMRGPFMYMDSYRFLLMAPDSVGFGFG